jgi:N-dimethylarginine dimethylaminohydrolase
MLETAIKKWLREHGWPFAHRRTQQGSADEGDLCLSERIPFTIEAKNSRKTTDRAAIGTWLKELETEVTNVGDEAGAVIHKRRGTTDVGESIVIMPLKYLNVLLTRAYGSSEISPQLSPKRRRVIPRSDPP